MWLHITQFVYAHCAAATNMDILQDDRYLEMPSPSVKEEQVLQQRFSSGGSGERYYGGSSGGGNDRSSHYYSREPTHDDRDRDRDLSSLSNSSSGSGHRRSQEPPEVDRGMLTINVAQCRPLIYVSWVCIFL